MADEKQKIAYIDPNNLSSYDTKTGLFRDNVTWKPEDLNFSVDIQVVVPDRDNCGRKDYADGDNLVIQKPFVSFFSGQKFKEKDDTLKHFLTDSYTNISYTEIKDGKSGNAELLGVESIDISFDSHFFPQVVIKFIDVRGASLMMPEEQDYYDRVQEEESGTKDTNGCRNFFRALFHFPYPVFFLTVKGFYGTRETFLLSVEDFKTNFNQQTGNFDVTIRFIGHMYGIYSDLPLNYLIIAPYIGGSDNSPNKYWTGNQTTSDGKFMFSDGTPIPTFIEFLDNYNKIDDAFTQALKTGGSDYDSVRRLISLRERNTILKDILNLKKEYDQNLCISFSTENSSEIIETKSFIVLLKATSGAFNIKRGQFKDIIDKYNTYLKKSNEEKIEGDECLKYFEDKYDDKSYPIGLEAVETYSDRVYVVLNDRTQVGKIKVFNTKNESVDTAYVFTKDSALKAINSGKHFAAIYRTFAGDGEFFDNIKKKIDELDNEITSEMNSNSETYNQVVKTVLKFTPTLENVFRMIYAHIDCFMHEFYGTLSNVLTESDKRKNTKLTPNVNINDTDIYTIDKEIILPPFTGFYKKDYATGQSTKIYPNEYLRDDKRHIAEVEFVEQIYEGINGLSNVYESLYKVDNEPVPEIPEPKQKFTPLTLLDVIYNGENPYLCLNAEERQEFLAEIIRVFTERLAVALETQALENSESALREPIKNEVRNIINSLPKDAKKALNIEIQKYFNANKTVDSQNNFILNILSDPTLNFSVKKHKFEFYVNEPTSLVTDVHNIREKGDSVQRLSNCCGSKPITNYTKLPETAVTAYFNYDKWHYLKSVDFKGGFWDCQDYNNPHNVEKYYDFVNNIIDKANGRTIEDGKMLLLQYDSGNSARNVYFEKELLNEIGDDIFKDAEMFLSSLFGENITSSYVEGLAEKTRIVRMPKFIRLFLGSQVYYHRKEGDNFKLSINRNGIFTNGKKPAKKIKGRTIEEIETLYPNIKQEFIDWALTDFRKIKEKIQEYSVPENIKVYSGNTWNKKSNYYDLEKTEPLQKVLAEFYTLYDFTLDISLLESNRLLVIKFILIKNFIKELSNALKSDSDVNANDEVPLDADGKEYISEEDADRAKEEIYYTQKGLYDKWLSIFKEDRFWLKSPSEDKRVSKQKVLGNSVPERVSEFNNFVFLDSFYNDIGQTFYIDAKVLYDILMRQIGGAEAMTNRSVLEFISDIAHEHKLLFIALPVYTNFYNQQKLIDVFTPHSPYDGSGSAGARDIGNTYILMYTHEVSHNVTPDNDNKNGGQYKKDSVDLGDTLGKITTECTETFCSGSLEKYTMPAFGVTFGRQNQQYFKNIAVNMENPRQTDFSIYNQFQLAAQEKRGDVNSPVTVGQNMYSIYSNRAYDCNVEMMGCVNIMPTMYFQLNNIPLFKGAYMITKVEHHIKAGDITTKFSGTRISRNAIPYLKYPINIEKMVERINGGSSSENSEQIQVEVPAPSREIDLNSENPKVSKYFTLNDFLRSDTATKNGYTEQFSPEKYIIDNIVRLAEFLDELREFLGYAIIVSSGYRCTRLNKAIKGSQTSAHSTGNAADIKPGNGKRMSEFKSDVMLFCQNYVKSGRKFDQYINEKSGNSEWVHIGLFSMDGKRQRCEYLKTTDGGKNYQIIDV